MKVLRLLRSLGVWGWCSLVATMVCIFRASHTHRLAFPRGHLDHREAKPFFHLSPALETFLFELRPQVFPEACTRPERQCV